MMSKVAKISFVDYDSSISKALDVISADQKLPGTGLIIIKPNLTNADKPPVTTDVRAVEAVYRYCRNHSPAETVIGEGCGSGTTADTYRKNGYVALAKQYGIRLIDFNKEDAVLLKNCDALVLKEFYMPTIVQNSFIVSVPVLKDHSFTKTTISMKNMFGIAPEPYYCGSWNKSKLHTPSTHKSVVDICCYKKPDLCVVDAVVVLTGMHLSGTHKRLNTILAGFDPVAIDAVGSELLGHKPEDIEYLKLSNGLLGSMDDIDIVDG